MRVAMAPPRRAARGWQWWALVLVMGCGAAAQGAGGKDWFEVEVTLAKSDFTDGDDGWEVIGEAADLQAESGAISALDEGSHLWFFSAPLKFLGDVRDSFGCRVSYSLGHYHSDSAGRQPTMVEDVVLISDLHNMTLLRSGIIKPWTYASNVEVQLDGSGRWTHAITGETAGDDDLRRSLSALSGLLIRGGYYHGRETTWIKDVYMGKKQRVQRSNPASSQPSMRPEDVQVPPSLSYTARLDDDIRLPPPPRSTRPRPSPRAPDDAELESGDVVSRALYDDVKDLKDELERSDQQLRGAVAELQGRLAASQEENRRLRGALVEARDKAERNGELADARTRNFKQCEKALAESKTQLDATSKRLETSDELRRQKQITIEELSTQVVGNPQLCEGLQVQYNDCARAREDAERRALQHSHNASACQSTLEEQTQLHKTTSADLELCQRRSETSSGAAEQVRTQLAEPLERVMSQLAVAQRDMRAADEKLAAMCLTRQAQFVTTAGGLLLVPFGVALIMGVPMLLLRGRLRSGLTVVANVGDIIVLLFWLASYAVLSFRDEIDVLLAKHQLPVELQQSMQPLVEWHKSLGPAAEHYLHMAGGCMYGLVVAMHLLSLFSAPDMLSAVQGFAFWGLGLHYYHGLSGGAGFGFVSSTAVPARGSAAGDVTGGGGGGAGAGGLAAVGQRGDHHELHLLLYIATMSVLVALRAPAGSARAAAAGSKAARGGGDGKWRPAGAAGSRGRRRGRTRRRGDEYYEEEEEDLLDVSEPLSDDISDSDEEEEELLRFPRDAARDQSLSVEAFAKTFLQVLRRVLALACRLRSLSRCMYVYIYNNDIHTCMIMHACMHAYIHTYIYMHTHTNTRARTHTLRVCVCVCVCVCVYNRSTQPTR